MSCGTPRSGEALRSPAAPSRGRPRRAELGAQILPANGEARLQGGDALLLRAPLVLPAEEDGLAATVSGAYTTDLIITIGLAP